MIFIENREKTTFLESKLVKFDKYDYYEDYLLNSNELPDGSEPLKYESNLVTAKLIDFKKAPGKYTVICTFDSPDDLFYRTFDNKDSAIEVINELRELSDICEKTINALSKYDHNEITKEYCNKMIISIINYDFKMKYNRL